ncbi:Uncharacterised protein [uncultured archaeon]|nr:Uncharacterised protein [uncultured archaeon]
MKIGIGGLKKIFKKKPKPKIIGWPVLRQRPEREDFGLPKEIISLAARRGKGKVRIVKTAIKSK